MAGRTIVEVYHRPKERAPLNEIFYWYAELPEAQRWTLVLELKKLLSSYAPEGFVRTEASQESEDRAAKNRV